MADVHIKQVSTNEVSGCKSNPCEIKVRLPTAPNTQSDLLFFSRVRMMPVIEDILNKVT